MGYASQLEDDERRRQDADPGFEAFLARAVVVGDTEPLDWRWELRLGGVMIARVADLLKTDGKFTYGTLFGDSPEFERFRPYFKVARDGRWSTKALDDPGLERLCEEVRHRGRFELHDRLTKRVLKEPRFQADGRVVRFCPR
jgi:hypothetical protein